MNRETDLEFARASIPANLKMLEALLLADPTNLDYRVQAATGFNGYALGFVEADDPARALALYQRALAHAELALAGFGVATATLHGEQAALDADLGKLDARAVPALFWAASSWAKTIELQLDDPERLADFPRVEALMRRALALDPGYYYGGPELFFGVYYGARAPMFGGDFARAQAHFERAAAYTGNQLLLIEVYRAKYLLRQMADRDGFHAALTGVLAATPTNPDLNLANAIARRDAAALLAQEEELF
jgi:tetratricopeptide (TPR) repeat protein